MCLTPGCPHRRINDGNDTVGLSTDTTSETLLNGQWTTDNYLIHISIVNCPLFMVIRFIIQNRHRPIDLLDKDQTDHLVGESHLA